MIESDRKITAAPVALTRQALEARQDLEQPPVIFLARKASHHAKKKKLVARRKIGQPMRPRLPWLLAPLLKVDPPAVQPIEMKAKPILADPGAA